MTNLSNINRYYYIYDNKLGRFITPDALWKKYYAWSPYHYSANNPVNASDGNGYWANEVKYTSHIHDGILNRTSRGYIAGMINYQFYNKWTNSAPAIAKYVETSSIFVLQKKLPNDIPASHNINTKNATQPYIIFDLNQTSNLNELEGNSLHEIVHHMGGNEFDAYSAQFAAGLLLDGNSKKQIDFDEMVRLVNSKPYLLLSGNEELRDNFIDGKITSEDIVKKMLENGNTILKEGVK